MSWGTRRALVVIKELVSLRPFFQDVVWALLCESETTQHMGAATQRTWVVELDGNLAPNRDPPHDT